MANFSIMADVPNPLFDSNGNPFSGAVLKAFEPGGTTSISIAIDEDGGSPQASITYNAQGKLEVTGNEILPFIDRRHKWGIFANATDAAANVPFYMGPFDDVPKPVSGEGVGILTLTLAEAVANAGAIEGQIVQITDRKDGQFEYKTGQTPNTFNIVAADAAGLDLVLNEDELDFLHTAHYGAVSGDITSLLNQFALSTHKNKIISGGSFSITSSVEFKAKEDSVHFDNPTFTADGTYTTGIITFGDVTTTLLGTTVAELTKGVRSIPFDTLSKDDVVSVWNPVDFSWLGGFDSTYRQGEYGKVSADSASGTTELDQPLFDTYPIGTKIYKLTNATPDKISGQVNFESSTKATRICVRVTQGFEVDVTGLQVKQKESTHTLQLYRCFRVSGDNMLAKQTAGTVSGTDYGLVITNCQNITCDGYFHAERHGVTTGGDDVDGGAINRWITVTGALSTTGLGSVAGAEMHGNIENARFGGRIVGMIFGGLKCFI